MVEFQNSYEACGYVKDCNKELFGKIFNENVKIKEIHIDIYIENPYMLFSRISGKNVFTLKNSNRFIVCKSDRHKTVVVNILLDEISNCMVKQYVDNQYEILFNIQNICYKIFIII